MSIRFHKGPSIVTLFHDPSSPASKQILQLLTCYQRNPHHPSPSPLSAPSVSGGGSESHGESCIVEAHGSGADANSYLRSAASDPPSAPLIQLEVVDRRRNPPTPDQLRSIVDYLASDSTSAADSGAERTQNFDSSGFDAAEHERRRKALKKHLADAGGKDGGMPRIKDGPLVVNWDDGCAATDVEGVRSMLERLKGVEEAQEGREKGKGEGCVVC